MMNQNTEKKNAEYIKIAACWGENSVPKGTFRGKKELSEELSGDQRNFQRKFHEKKGNFRRFYSVTGGEGQKKKVNQKAHLLLSVD